MIINLTLNQNTQGKIDFTEPLILPENELIFKLNSNVYNLSTVLFSARNGEKEIKAKLVPPYEVDLTELLFAGRIETEISLLSKGEVVKTWRIQDIVIKDTNHTYEAIPEIEFIKGAIRELNEKLKRNNII